MCLGGGGDQHSASGSLGQRATRRRPEKETGSQPAERTPAELHQELARRTNLQRVRINPAGLFKHSDETENDSPPV